MGLEADGACRGIGNLATATLLNDMLANDLETKRNKRKQKETKGNKRKVRSGRK